jgi:branched-chain amino acid aminotransferase
MPPVFESLKEMLKDLYDQYVYIDGKFVKGEEAKISVWDHAFLYGDGVFEGIRAYDGKVFALDEHLNRLFESAKALNIVIPISKEELGQAILETLRKNKLKDAHIRPIVTRGVGRPGMDPKRAVRASVVVLAYPFPPYAGEKPLRMIISSIRRKSPYAVDSKIKSLNYLDNILAKQQATAASVDEAVMMDVNGCVAEGTGENIFVVKNGKLYTPTTVAALDGITRRIVMELASKFGVEVQEKSITYQELYVADEVFLTGTGAEIVAVKEIDGRIIGNGEPGPLTEKITQEYKQYVRTTKVTPIYEA